MLGERRGSQAVIKVAALAAAVSPVFALAAHLAGSGWLVAAYPIVFVALGIVNSAWVVGFANYVLGLAPDGLHGAYIGLSNTLIGLLFVAPIAGGWLLEVSSYTVLFGLTAVGILAGFWFAFRLDPIGGTAHRAG
jgi:dipeptide/tripeptide permease